MENRQLVSARYIPAPKSFETEALDNEDGW